MQSLLVAAFCVSVPLAAAAQSRVPSAAAPDKIGEAYAQFLLGHRLAENDDAAGAVAAYKRAMELDPHAADIPAELAGLYLRQNKTQDAISTAEQALKIEPANREANRVLGLVYAALADASQQNPPRARSSARSDDTVAKAIHYLEVAIDHPVGEADPNVRATLSRLYLRSGAYDKAIPMLADLVAQESGWQDGPLLLAEAYAGAGRVPDGIAWLEQHATNDPRLLPTLGDFYERERRWADAAKTYASALQRTPRNNALKTRYASALLNVGGRDNLGQARDALTEVVAARTPPDTQALYLLSQANRRLGDSPAAEAAARRVIAQNNASPWGYYALAEALEVRHAYQTVVDDLAPVIAEHRRSASPGAGGADESFDVGLLLPHLGFAYQELGQYDKAIASFEDARRLAPKDPAVAGYLIEANIAAKKYGAAIDLARAALADHPDDLGLSRLQAQALRQSGKADQGIALLEGVVKKHADEPMAYVALAQLYSDAARGAQAVKVLQDAQAKFPTDNAIAFELGSVFDKQKKFAEAEASFRQVLAREPDNAAALNYIGYMLAERGERLDESVNYLKKALQIDPDNGSYLDSLGWAYFKSDKLDLAEDNLRRAADQLRMNSVIQEHYGEVLFKLGRLDEAIAAWTRALAGDGADIDRADIDKKIRAAKQKLNKK
ncbi:MAG: tetratricopeptide repeat protein [Acidobacteria bacterium]|nr:tetratricopeptide repeat protein [Acidobacteriota bacterium]